MSMQRDSVVPRTQYTRAGALLPGDHVWLPNGRFGDIESVTNAGPNVHVYFRDGSAATLDRARYVLVAVVTEDARAWNQRWEDLNDRTRNEILETYGHGSIDL